MATTLTPDQAAAAVASCEALCWHVARRVTGGRATAEDLEDIAAEVRAQLVRAARTFDPSRGCKFITYVSRLAWVRASRANVANLRRGLAGSRRCRPTPGVVSLDDVAPGTDGWTAGAGLAGGADPAAAAERADVWAAAARVLVGRQRQAVPWVYRDGLTLADVAARLGVSKQRAQQLVENGLTRLRRAWGATHDHAGTAAALDTGRGGPAPGTAGRGRDRSGGGGRTGADPRIGAGAVFPTGFAATRVAGGPRGPGAAPGAAVPGADAGRGRAADGPDLGDGVRDGAAADAVGPAGAGGHDPHGRAVRADAGLDVGR